MSKPDSIKIWIRLQIDKALVIIQSAVTLIAIVTTICTVALTQVVPDLPEPLASQVTVWAVRLLGALTAATLVIRRVTPVVKELRGVLPVEDPSPTSDDENLPVE